MRFYFYWPAYGLPFKIAVYTGKKDNNITNIYLACAL